MDTKDIIISVEELEQNIDIKKNEISKFCKEQGAGEISFFSFEALLVGHIAKIACLYIQLFVLVRHEKLDYRSWLDSGLYYLKNTPIFRTVKTITYTVELSQEESTFSNPIKIERLFQSTIMLQLYYHIDFNTTYYWRVIAIDEYGSQTYSTYRSFTTLNPNNNDNIVRLILTKNLLGGIKKSTVNINIDQTGPIIQI